MRCSERRRAVAVAIGAPRGRVAELWSLGVWQAQSRAGVYAEASAIVYTLGQNRGVTAIAKIADGLVLLRM